MPRKSTKSIAEQMSSPRRRASTHQGDGASPLLHPAGRVGSPGPHKRPIDTDRQRLLFEPHHWQPRQASPITDDLAAELLNIRSHSARCSQANEWIMSNLSMGVHTAVIGAALGVSSGCVIEYLVSTPTVTIAAAVALHQSGEAHDDRARFIWATLKHTEKALNH